MKILLKTWVKADKAYFKAFTPKNISEISAIHSFSLPFTRFLQKCKLSHYTLLDMLQYVYIRYEKLRYKVNERIHRE